MPGAKFAQSITPMYGKYSESRVGRPVPGDLDNTFVGPNGALGPYAYLPGNLLNRSKNMRHYYDPTGLFNYVTTDAAVGGEWFATLNSGTVGQSAVAGYEGLPLLTTAASATAETFIHNYGFVATSVAGLPRLAVMIWSIYCSDEAVNTWSHYGGFGVKQAAPQTTQFTDGAWIECVTATALQFNGRLRTNTGTAQTTPLTGYVPTAGKAQSFQFGVVLFTGSLANGGNTIFFARDPSATTPINGGNWTAFPASAANLAQNPQTAARVLRPHLSWVSTGSAVAASVETPEIAVQRLANF